MPFESQHGTQHLTPEALQEIDRAVGEVLAARYGEVTIKIEEGLVRWVSPSPSRRVRAPAALTPVRMMPDR